MKSIFSDVFVKMGPWPLIEVGAIGLFFKLKKYWKEKLVLFVWFIFPLLVQSEYAKVFTVRYILFTLPACFILAASAILVKRKLSKIFVVLFFGLFIFISIYFYYQLLTYQQNYNFPSSERSGSLEE